MRSLTTYFVAMVLAVAFAGAPVSAAPQYRIGAVYGLGNLKASEKPYFGFNHLWGVSVGMVGERWSLDLSLRSQRNFSDSSYSGHFGFFADENDATTSFRVLRIGLDAGYNLAPARRIRPLVGAGLGYGAWKYIDPVGDTVVQTIGEKGNRVDFTATELFLSGSAGLEFDVSERFVLAVSAGVDYFTGIGASFVDSVDDGRGRLLMRSTVMLSYLFGGGIDGSPSSERWRSSESWSRVATSGRRPSKDNDSDGDGVADKRDRCPGTPEGARVDRSGCPSDADSDGVPDGIDECPRTSASAKGYVDIHGCPVDGDFDGVPDYRDRCRSGPVGAAVDETGCPADSDNDGVYDGIDDCPGTAAGIEVDDRGCIDVTFLRDTLRVYVDYPSGSFEVDMRTRERLAPLVRTLKILTHVKIDIAGYTDNIGPAEANEALSQKRANRMRDWLESQGIARSRMTAVGRGETNFIVSNDTADGRARNRRIEFIFRQ